MTLQSILDEFKNKFVDYDECDSSECCQSGQYISGTLEEHQEWISTAITKALEECRPEPQNYMKTEYPDGIHPTVTGEEKSEGYSWAVGDYDANVKAFLENKE